jgi:hypothetical protein
MSEDCSGAHSGEFFGVQFLYMGLDDLQVISLKTHSVLFIRAEYFLRMEVGECAFVAPYWSEYVHSGMNERDMGFLDDFLSDDSVVWYQIYPGVEDGKVIPLNVNVNPTGDDCL